MINKKVNSNVVTTAILFLNFKRFLKKETIGLNNNDTTIAIIK
jgi:hypothetical protein